MQVRLFGTFELALDGIAMKPPGTSKARSMLAFLALRRGEPIRRETLMGEFWPDAYPTSARNNLKTTLSSIRRTLRDAGVDADAILNVGRDTVRWIASTWVDSREFEGCSTDVVEERRRAITIYRGEFAPSDGNQWAEETRERLALRFEHLLRSELAFAPSAQVAEQLLAIDPFSDEAYTALIESALRAGDRRTAQAIFRRYAAALAEIDAEPPMDLAARVGVRKLSARHRDALGFCGRIDELAELRRILASSEKRVVILSGICSIGKTALANEALQSVTRDGFALVDVTTADLAGGAAELARRVQRASAAILCAQPEMVAPLRSAFPDAEEISLGALAYEEVAVALRRRFDAMRPDVVDAIWRRSSGHPLILETIVSLLDNSDSPLTAATVERLRLPRDIERRFEAQLQDAGKDVVEVAVLLALEPQLDNDDIAALLGWNLMRSIDARERLAKFQYAVFYEGALRMLSPGRRQHTIERIAERLKLHEDPRAKIRVAEHLLELGRAREAASSYLEAATAFAAFAAWQNAERAADSGLAVLESIATSADAIEVLRNLHQMKARALYQQGAFVSAVRSLKSVMEIADGDEYAALRANTLVTIGHALARIGLADQAWAVAKQALEESRDRNGIVLTDLPARHLMSRVLKDRFQYMEALAVAEAGFERSLEGHDWVAAMQFANVLIEVSRRLMHFKDCYTWAERALEAALLAGPVLEAEARFMFATVKFVVNRHDDALEEILSALPLIEGVRPRNVISSTPVEQLQWMLHHALAHAYSLAGAYDEAVVETEWLLRSPWTLNTSLASAQLTSLAIDLRLAMGSVRDLAAARSLLDRIPAASGSDLAVALDTLARARVAKHEGGDGTAALLHTAMNGFERVAEVHPDQVHTSLYRLGETAREIDDTLAVTATELAQRHERIVIHAAGDLWSGPAAPLHSK